jgi:hypothetical protein
VLFACFVVKQESHKLHVFVPKAMISSQDQWVAGGIIIIIMESGFI